MKLQTNTKQFPYSFLAVLGIALLTTSVPALACGDVRLLVSGYLQNREIFDSACDGGSMPFSNSLAVDNAGISGSTGATAFASGTARGDKGWLVASTRASTSDIATAGSTVSARVGDFFTVSRGSANITTSRGYLKAQISIDLRLTSQDYAISGANFSIFSSGYNGGGLSIDRLLGYGIPQSNQFGERASATFWQPGLGSVETSPYQNTYDIYLPFVFGEASFLSFQLQLSSHALYSFSTLADYGNSSVDAAISWNGILGVTDNDGNALTGWTVSSASGTDYLKAISAPVPEPTSYAMLLAGLGLLWRSRQKKLPYTTPAPSPINCEILGKYN